jgi:hypothetical protein
MGFGKRITGGGGNFLPILKIDASSGTIYVEVRERDDYGNWGKVQRTISLDEFRAGFDLERAERGWIRFPRGSAPETRLVPLNVDPGAAPAGEGWKEGFRLIAVIDGTAFEFMSTSVACWIAFSAAHDAWEAERSKHIGDMPVLGVKAFHKRSYGMGTSFEPEMALLGWMRRPSELDDIAPREQAPVRAGDDLQDSILF